jgi:uncharacterized membrane-anchored protein YhcB (DUF1043 family)
MAGCAWLYFGWSSDKESPVFSALAFWLTAAGCVTAGAAAGWLLRIALDPSERKLREAEAQLSASEATLDAYRRQITDHFRGTADRVNRLTEDYRDLHSHLAQGAMSLCTPAAGDTPLLTSLSGSGARNTIAASVNPPLDYARPVPGDGADSIDRDHDV